MAFICGKTNKNFLFYRIAPDYIKKITKLKWKLVLCLTMAGRKYKYIIRFSFSKIITIKSSSFKLLIATRLKFCVRSLLNLSKKTFLERLHWSVIRNSLKDKTTIFHSCTPEIICKKNV